MNSPMLASNGQKIASSPAHATMSASLKDRLKKSGRYHSSFVTPRQVTSASSQGHTPLSSLPMTAKSVLCQDQLLSSHVPSITSPESTKPASASHISIKTETSSHNKPFQTPPVAGVSTLTPPVSYYDPDKCYNNSRLMKRRRLSYTAKHTLKDALSPNPTCIDPTSPCCLEPRDSPHPRNPIKQEPVDESKNNELSDSPHRDTCSSDCSSDLNKTEDKPAERNHAVLKQLKLKLEQELKEKEEQLRKLRMVKVYRDKNNLTELQKLIDTWRDVAQRALVDLHNLQPQPRPSLTDLVNHLQIDHELIHYVSDDESFT